jgi:hypothetical protein
VIDDLVQSVDQKNYERWHFTVSEVSCKMGPENAHGCTQNAENGFSFVFRAVPQRWR